VAKLVDAQDLKSCGCISVWVRVPPRLPIQKGFNNERLIIYSPVVEWHTRLIQNQLLKELVGSNPARATTLKGEKAMRKILIMMFFLLISLSLIVPVNAAQSRRQQQSKQYQKQQQYQKYNQPRYHDRGYNHRYYGHRNYHPRNYRGHWRSWNDWDNHYRHNRNLYRHGRYYRKDGCLYFEFQNQDGRFIF
jgi:hypothetical protein